MNDALHDGPPALENPTSCSACVPSEESSTTHSSARSVISDSESAKTNASKPELHKNDSAVAWGKSRIKDLQKQLFEQQIGNIVRPRVGHSGLLNASNLFDTPEPSDTSKSPKCAPRDTPLMTPGDLPENLNSSSNPHNSLSLISPECHESAPKNIIYENLSNEPPIQDLNGSNDLTASNGADVYVHISASLFLWPFQRTRPPSRLPKQWTCTITLTYY